MSTTAAAVLVVAVTLLVGAFALVSLVRESLRDGLESSADQRTSALVDQIESSGLPTTEQEGEDPDDLVWQVIDESGGPSTATWWSPKTPVPAGTG